ncbi:hypothetical protein [Actinoplanes teichomyceticus]|uniref:Uncharacterized protein n=1 Tax=Actinoplanes teichomyceticus TaxID=1867 RepID=A0A561VMA7_ACTTI|nr:hypothetical protein [Actinoplanes teichomyceticus]TWG12761.1 hypothetical protein FHX34_105629 [Actinoplanes teichomyceticus]GIF13494.1 hypothetical protein Ate01nite_35260 [Actinoplanes teichomyceticus]
MLGRRAMTTRLAAVGAAVAVATMSGAAPALAASDNYILNAPQYTNTYVKIGVIHEWEADQGLYDGLLPPGRTTEDMWHWDHGTGVWIGDGYCAQVRIRGTRSAPWERAGPDVVGPRQFAVGIGSYWAISPYRC